MARPPMAVLLSTNYIVELNDSLCAAYYEQFVSIYEHSGSGAEYVDFVEAESF